jgi:hypothetical protein
MINEYTFKEYLHWNKSLTFVSWFGVYNEMMR